MKIKIYIRPNTELVDIDWNFTGRIKYEKYHKRTNIYFEVTYKNIQVAESRWDFALWLITFGQYESKITEKTVTSWFSEKQFWMIEVPEETIVECGK